jgi:hypothetical protein
MTQMIFYKDVVAISAEAHSQWKMRPPQKFEFAANTNSVPLLLPEIPDAAREYPILFIKTGDDQFVLAALLGLRENENLIVDSEGKWSGRYLPAFIRRYPFILSETEAGQHVVCADQSATDLLGVDLDGQALFEKGQPSAFTQQIMAFLDSFRVQAEASSQWANRLNQLGLLEAASADARLNDGGHFTLNGLYVVSEKKLHALPAAEIQALFERGELARIYAHLLSLGHFSTLIDHLASRRKVEAANETPPSQPGLH